MNKLLVASTILSIGLSSVAQASSASYGPQPSQNGSSSSAHYGNPDDASSSSAHYGPPAGAPMPPVSVTPGDDQPSGNYRQQDVYWVAGRAGMRLPVNAVVSGHQPQYPTTLYACHASYNNAVHPGKLVGSRCNISYAGREIALPSYEVLVSRIPLAWVSVNGDIPNNAVPGGFEGSRTLYICQANYRGGVHSGKVVAGSCNFGWGGQEVVKPYYRVLTAIVN